jgi:hypothetical protein
VDAPLYSRTDGYVEPRLAQTEFGVDAISVADLLRSDALLAVVEREVPGFGKMARAPRLYATLTNVTLREMASFSFFAGVVKPGALERIDAEFRMLPTDAWPGL